MIENRIYKSELVEWSKIKDLQPENLKINYNIQYLRDTILKYGISKAFDVCEIAGEVYFLDGHTRSNMFQTLTSEGVEIPKKLMCNFCKVKNKQEAVKILMEVHNQKLNPMSLEAANEWLETEDIETEDVNFESLNITNEKIVSDSEEFGDSFSLPSGDKEPFQQMTFTLADKQAEIIKNAIDEIKKTDEYKYCETFGNENSNGNALYLLIAKLTEQR